jgi:UrcA family protein
MIKTLVSVALAAAALAAAPAAAENSAYDLAKVQVFYGDLNLASDAGRGTLDRRIRSAARSICGTEASRGPAGLNAIKACQNQAIASASGQVEQALASLKGSGSGIMVAARR